MMTRDGQKTDDLAATIARAGADAVEAAKRIVEVEARHGDISELDAIVVKVPYLFDGSGNPQVCKDALALARELHERERPRRRGCYEMDDLGSLVAWAKRFAVAETTAVFIEASGLVDSEDGKVRVVVDELQANHPLGALRELRCELKLKLHDRLRAWIIADCKPMSIEAFSDFAMRAVDELGDAALVSAISNVEVHEECKWVRSVDPESSAVKLTSETTKRTTKIPSVFRFAVPVFDGDDEQNAMTFIARLTIKAPQGKPQFTYEITDLKPRLAQAMETIRQRMIEVTPHVYMGSPG